MTDRHRTVDPNGSASEGLTDATSKRTVEPHEFGNKGGEKPDIQPVRENSAASGRSEITRSRVVRELKSTPRPPQVVSVGDPVLRDGASSASIERTTERFAETTTSDDTTGIDGGADIEDTTIGDVGGGSA